MTQSQLQSALQEWILEPFRIADSGELEVMSTPRGELVQARDEYLNRYRRRLESIRTIPSASKSLIEDHERVVKVLEGLEPQEPLTYWEAKTEKHTYAGVISRLGMVSFYGPLLPNSEAWNGVEQ